MSKDGLQYTVNTYIRYYQLIGNIINKLSEQGIEIDRNEFDHILWYGFKGKLTINACYRNSLYIYAQYRARACHSTLKM